LQNCIYISHITHQEWSALLYELWKCADSLIKVSISHNISLTCHHDCNVCSSILVMVFCESYGHHWSSHQTMSLLLSTKSQATLLRSWTWHIDLYFGSIGHSKSTIWSYNKWTWYRKLGSEWKLQGHSWKLSCVLSSYKSITTNL